MTAKTSDFSGLLFYNPVAHGFNPVPDGTVFGPDNMDEGTSASWNLVTWDIPDGNIYWRIVPSGDNLNESRFTNGGLHGNISVERNRTSLYITVSADNATSTTGQSFDILFSKTLNGAPFAAKYGVGVNDTSQTPGMILNLIARNTNSWNHTGTTWYDLTSNHYDATIVGGPAYSNNGMVLDGDGQYAQLPASTYFKGDFTIVAWVYLNSYASWSRVIDFSDGPETANQVLLAVTDGPSGYPVLNVGSTQFTANEQIPLGTWAQIAARMSGTQGRIFINGQKVGHNAGPWNAMDIAIDSVRHDCFIAHSNYSSDADLDGSIGELQIYNYALSDSDIQGNYDDLSSLYSPTPTYTMTTAGSVTSVDEGVALEFDITTTNVADGTTLYWSTGDNFNGGSGGRFSPGSTGTVDVSSNSASFTITVSADNMTAISNPQQYNVVLYTGNYGGSGGVQVASVENITVNDTSQSSGGGGGGPPPPSLVSIDVEPQNANIDSTTTYSQQMTATGYYDDSSSQDFTNSASWSIGTEYLSIDSNGLVTIPPNAVESGTVTAYQDGVSGTATITAYVPVPSPAAFVFSHAAGVYFEVTGSTSNWNFADDNFTIEFWSKATSSSASTIFTVMSQGPQTGIDITYDSGHLSVFDGHDGYITWPEPTPGVWTHVAIINAGGTVYAFYNGVRQTILSGAWVPGYHWGNGTDVLYVGQRGPNVSGQNFDGNLYGIRINSNVQYIDLFNLQNFDPYSVALPPTKVLGTVLLINPTDQAAADTSNSAHGIIYGSPPTGSTSDTPQNTHTYGPIATAYNGTSPGEVVFDIATYPAIVDVPSYTATIIGTVFANPTSPVPVTLSYVNSGDSSKWILQYNDPGGTSDTTTSPPDTFTITW